MAQAAGEGEDLKRPCRPELFDRRIESAVHIGEVRSHVASGEQLARKCPAPGEQPVWELASKHSPVGHPLAGTLLGQGVERCHTGRRKREEVAVLTAVHDKGVTAGGPGPGQVGDRVDAVSVPRQCAADGDGWHGGDAHPVPRRPFSAAGPPPSSRLEVEGLPCGGSGPTPLSGSPTGGQALCPLPTPCTARRTRWAGGTSRRRRGR